MIDHLSPREEDDLDRAAAEGAVWPALLRAHFLDGSRLCLGWDASCGERQMLASLPDRAAAASAPDAAAPQERGAALRSALEEAARFCAAHGLHFLFFEGKEPGDEPLGERRWFMAVG